MNGGKKLAAFCVQRRAVGIAVFLGMQLGFCDTKQLIANRGKAAGAALGFANWILENFDVESVAIEDLGDSNDVMRAATQNAVEEMLRSRGISIQKFPTGEFLASFTHPSKAHRKEARSVVATIWPILDSKKAHPAQLDAVALGLYCQTDRLFNN